MSRRVPDDRLEILHLRVAGELKAVAKNDARRGSKPPVWVQVDARELAPLLDELRQRRKRPEDSRLSPTTRKLMAMKVGDVVEFPPMSNGTLTTNRNTARTRLGEPDARWRAKTLPSGRVRVERMPNGTPHEFGKAKSPAVAILAGMLADGRPITLEPGEFPPTGIHKGVKALARIQMGNSWANWRTENLANGGLRVWRTR